MIQLRVLPLIAVACSLALASCTTMPRKCPSSASPGPRVPGPAKIDMRADLTPDLPGEMSAELKMPQKLKATLRVKVDAEALDDNPDRSRFLGTLSLAVTAVDGNHEYPAFETTAEGEADGSPGGGGCRGVHLVRKRCHAARQAAEDPRPAGTRRGSPDSRAWRRPPTRSSGAGDFRNSPRIILEDRMQGKSIFAECIAILVLPFLAACAS
jgi:hypothetical protein